MPSQHRPFIFQVLDDLETLDVDNALQIDISELPDSVVNTRTLLYTAARNRGMSIAVQTDDNFLYIWKPVQITA